VNVRGTMADHGGQQTSASACCVLCVVSSFANVTIDWAARW
jgi:hypothetical protein